eukprot:Rmarinus@m.705
MVCLMTLRMGRLTLVMSRRFAPSTLPTTTAGIRTVPARSGHLVRICLVPTFSWIQPRPSSTFSRSRIPALLHSSGVQRRVSFARRTCAVSSSKSRMLPFTPMLSIVVAARLSLRSAVSCMAPALLPMLGCWNPSTSSKSSARSLLLVACTTS